MPFSNPCGNHINRIRPTLYLFGNIYKCTFGHFHTLTHSEHIHVHVLSGQFHLPGMDSLVCCQSILNHDPGCADH